NRQDSRARLLYGGLVLRISSPVEELLMHRRPGLIALASVVVLVAGCSSSPTGPSPQKPVVVTEANPPVTRMVSGTVWAYGPSGLAPVSGGTIFGWLENVQSGHTTGPVKISADGHYEFAVPDGFTHVSVFGGPGHQPCAVSWSPDGGTTGDVYH